MCGGHVAIRSYSGDVPIRVIVLVLALLMAAGATSSALGTVAAAPDVAAAVDEAPDVDPAITETVALEAPVRRELRQFAASADASTGRLHRSSIFRPPRCVASR